MEERGIAQIIDTRRFSIPVSRSIRQLVPFVILILLKLSDIVNVKIFAFTELRESILALTSSHSTDLSSG